MTDLMDDLFHRCALTAGFLAWIEGRLDDNRYVRDLCYQMYEEELAKKNAEPRATTNSQ